MFNKKPILVALSFLSFLFLGIKVHAQNDTVSAQDQTMKFERVEVEARFKGGDAAWIKFLEKNLDPEVPVKMKAPAGRYTVVIQFVVNKEGKILDIKALTNHGYGMEEEVIRLLKRSPDWEPATQNGRIVKAYRKQPVTFQIDEKKKKKKNKDD